MHFAESFLKNTCTGMRACETGEAVRSQWKTRRRGFDNQNTQRFPRVLALQRRTPRGLPTVLITTVITVIIIIIIITTERAKDQL